jgi:hypothetical protein
MTGRASPSHAVSDAARRRWTQLCADAALYPQGDAIQYAGAALPPRPAELAYRYEPERCVRVAQRRPASAPPPRGANSQRHSSRSSGSSSARLLMLERLFADARDERDRLVPPERMSAFADDANLNPRCSDQRCRRSWARTR